MSVPLFPLFNAEYLSYMSLLLHCLYFQINFIKYFEFSLGRIPNEGTTIKLGYIKVILMESNFNAM
jgi:hypothetical protein